DAPVRGAVGQAGGPGQGGGAAEQAGGAAGGAATGSATTGGAAAAETAGAGAEGEPGAAGAGAGGGRGGGGGGGAGGFGFGGGRGPLVDPGEYTIAVSAAGKSESKTAVVDEDPRITMSTEDRAKRRQAIAKLYSMARDADEGRRRIVALRTSLAGLTDGWKRANAARVPDCVKD